MLQRPVSSFQLHLPEAAAANTTPGNRRDIPPLRAYRELKVVVAAYLLSLLGPTDARKVVEGLRKSGFNWVRSNLRSFV